MSRARQVFDYIMKESSKSEDCWMCLPNEPCGEPECVDGKRERDPLDVVKSACFMVTPNLKQLKDAELYEDLWELIDLISDVTMSVLNAKIANATDEQKASYVESMNKGFETGAAIASGVEITVSLKEPSETNALTPEELAELGIENDDG